jgi:hypothetical protein
MTRHTVTNRVRGVAALVDAGIGVRSGGKVIESD